MTTPRARAGRPYERQPMDCAGSGCNYPEGNCLGFCNLHRVPMPINFAGPEPVPAVELVAPVKVQQPEPGLIAGFIKLIGGKWKCE